MCSRFTRMFVCHVLEKADHQRWAFALMQVALRRAMQNHGLWDAEWAGTWAEQQTYATRFPAALLPDGCEITSLAYKRNKSRDGTNVLVYFEQGQGQRPFVGQVQFFVRLEKPNQQVAEGEEDGEHDHGGAGSSGSGSSSGPDQGDKGSGNSARFAILKWYSCRHRDEPDLADLLLEAREGDFLAGRGNAVPLQLITSPVHVHRRPSAGDTWLSFVPVLGRSNRLGFRDVIPVQ